MFVVIDSGTEGPYHSIYSIISTLGLLEENYYHNFWGTP